MITVILICAPRFIYCLHCVKLDSLHLHISMAESVVQSSCILVLFLILQFWYSPSPNTSIRTRTHELSIPIDPGNSTDTTGVCILCSVSSRVTCAID